jgi:hypothetical protein
MRAIPTPPIQPGAVYLLQRHDRSRFKVGWAAVPLRRIRMLPEFDALQLDIAASKVLWLPTRQRAEQVERAVHKTLAPHAADAGHQRDGHSEWFLQLALPLALRALTQMPASDRTDRPARLVPVQAEPPPVDAVSIETGPVDTWWALEDLWSRLAMHGQISVDTRGDAHELVIHDFRHAWNGPVGELRREVMDLDTYRWHAAGTRNEFVKVIDYRGDDLVCTLATMRLIETWPEGDDLIWQVKGFLLRLQRQGEVTRRRRPAGQPE